MLSGWIALGLGVALMAVAIALLVRGTGADSRVTVVIPLINVEVSATGSGAVLLVAGLALTGTGFYLMDRAANESLVAADSITASASSVHSPDRGLTYDASNTLDGNANTAWNGTGFRPGYWLRYDFGQPRRLKTVSLVNGYAKDEATFRANARPKQVRFVMTGNRQFRTTLRDSMEPQDVDGPFGTTRYVRLVVLSVYPGNNRRLNDVALTDVEFFD